MVKYKLDTVMTLIYNAQKALEELKEVETLITEIAIDVSDEDKNKFNEEIDKLEKLIQYYV